VYYVQDPSAQATVAALPDIAPDSRVLDLCAAPGGKSTALASRLSDAGVLVSNELSPARAKALVGNLERMGARNAIVLNTDAREIAALYENVFDLVLLDAPCSGEGMLRKYAVAGEEWSEENVVMCARRQGELLDAAARTVAPGGCLLYSTCTFSPEENEYAVAAFLRRHPDFSLEELPPALTAVTAPGIDLDTLREKGFFPIGEDTDIPTPEGITLCRRFYPHVCAGEGQFIARLRRDTAAVGAPVFGYRDARHAPTPADRRAAEEFLRATLLSPIDPSSLYADGERIYLFTPDFPLPPRHVFLSGVTVGEMKKGRILPHHQFFSAYGKDFKNILSLTSDSPEARAYLHGEELAAPDGADGFAAVLVDGIPTGGAKISGGRAKNHYPKGLRTP
jgi:NOL1/NOP2/fmu family ribosome biogenesis protein